MTASCWSLAEVCRAEDGVGPEGSRVCNAVAASDCGALRTNESPRRHEDETDGTADAQRATTRALQVHEASAPVVAGRGGCRRYMAQEEWPDAGQPMDPTDAALSEKDCIERALNDRSEY